MNEKDGPDARRRRLVHAGLAGALGALGVAGCSNEKSLGAAERIGNFSFERFSDSYSTDRGYPTTYSYTRVYYGQWLGRPIEFPVGEGGLFQRVTRLPSAQPAWVLEARGGGDSSALLTEKNGAPVVQALCSSDLGTIGPIQQLDAVRWHIPSYHRGHGARLGGGRVLDGRSLAQRELPLQPENGGSSMHAFLGCTTDASAAAWLARVSGETVVLVGDGQTPQALAVTADAAALATSPQSSTETHWPRWFESAFQWQRDATGRWQVARR